MNIFNTALLTFDLIIGVLYGTIFISEKQQ